MDTFSAPARQTAPEACASLIRGSILAGRLTPGERLPPERALAEQLGVTRVTLRSALAGLAAEGLIESRQGSGTRVRDFRRAGGPGLLQALVEQAAAAGRVRDTVRDLLVLRRGLARGVLESLAARPPDPDACAQVDLAVAHFGEVARAASPAGEDVSSAPELARLADADLAVLRAIIEASGSTVFPLALNPVGAALNSLPVLRAAVYRQPLANLAGWEALSLWLRAPELDSLPAFLALLEERDRDTLALLGDSEPSP